LKFANTTNLTNNDYIGYEYLIVCKKIENIKTHKFDFQVEDKFSVTSKEKAMRQGFDDVGEYFESIGVN
jgi:hypothetical protein